jgi:hypothetical protein
MDMNRCHYGRSLVNLPKIGKNQTRFSLKRPQIVVKGVVKGVILIILQPHHPDLIIIGYLMMKKQKENFSTVEISTRQFLFFFSFLVFGYYTRINFNSLEIPSTIDNYCISLRCGVLHR